MAHSKETENLIQDTLAEILKHMGIPFRRFKVNYDEGESVYHLDIETDEASKLIGYHGESVYALQQILKTIVWNKGGESIFVVLDVDSYRKRQEDSVKKMALRKVEDARKTLEDQPLPPMSGYFRRIVHMYLTQDEFNDITTESIGEGDHRQVVIKVGKI